MSISDCWRLLAVEPTDDVEQIREAYLKVLPSYHPEDDPAGFMKLRAAYEEALEIARNIAGTQGGEDEAADADTEDDDPVIISIRAMLDDFPGRMEVTGWEKLFEAAGVDYFDRQEVVSEKLLVALMDGQYLPRRIWLFFDRVFAWSTRANHLKEIFPPGYIEYVLNGMRYERAVRDEFFDYEKNAGEDFDAFVDAYHALAEALHSWDMDKASELVSENQGPLFTHPDYRLLIARMARMREAFGEEKEILEALDVAWPDDPFIRTAIGDMYLNEKPKNALSFYLGVLDSHPDHYGAKIGAARARYAEDLFEEAKADAYDLLMIDPFDGAAMSVFSLANEALVPIFSERLEKKSEDMDARYKLASCFYNTGKYKESLDLIADVLPDEAYTAKHYELYADLFILENGEDLTDADRGVLLEYIEAWEKAETDHRRLRFLPEKYHSLGMSDIALEKAEVLLAEFPGDPEICRAIAQIQKERGDEHAAFAAVAAGLEKSPTHAGLLSIEALLHEISGNLGAAADSANMALDNFPYNLEMWELLGLIYERAEQYDDILDTIRRAEEYGLSSEKLSLLKAIALYETEDPDDEARGLFEERLEKEPDNAVCLEKLSILYARNGQAEDAINLANCLVEKHEGPYTYLLRGWIYAQFPGVSDGFSKARARGDFRKAIELDEQYAPAWYQLGILAYDDGRMAEAAADFQMTLDIDPNFSDVHFSLALAYENCGDFINALRVLNEGITYIDDGDTETHTRLFLKKSDILFDHHRYKEYIEIGEEAAEKESDKAWAAVLIGRLAYAYYDLDEDEKAEALFERAFEELKPYEDENAHYLPLLNSWYASFMRYAKKDYEKSLELHQNIYDSDKSFRTMVCLAEAYCVAGQNKEAEKLFKKALSLRDSGPFSSKAAKEMKPDLESACTDYRTGQCYYELKNYKKAKEYLERAIRRAPKEEDCSERCCFEALFMLGLIALAEGDRESAREYYRRTIEMANDRDYRSAANLFD